ncbi:mitogen-activated protein kinase kinase kinase 5-like isoform X3 [Limulus polyphemus]|nr:mitogen-activated protein kinase kinase kinase 5-like isoform X3 [Limulus polyphemus]XP_022245301.1 mitogen-activated protein kinase kinase kinase 5-like isoform X3 [Limulus polyphemus]XP_022245302.1 mitogen-activated protein kinase kinase kinase 5-like isoform X3 [Limulus polyphemus]XP_022245303.1 mitogen-activated protein kinase kinase kinase 5-like isoform X3 [Limulus polyphemus]XP_022245304.1 mitogen-activated protein kinase kinase kinase 5-like isoform X3 [Limulus polyphemus]
MSDVDSHSVSSGPLSVRPHINVAVVIDLTVSVGLNHRRGAYEEIQKACNHIGATVHHVPFQKLDFGEANVLDLFYNADVAVVDLSILDQQNSLFYQLGVRESFGMKQNILIHNDHTTDVRVPVPLKIPPTCGNYNLIPYKLNDMGTCVVTESGALRLVGDEPVDGWIHFGMRLRKLLQEVEVQNKAHMKEKFLADLRKARESYSGEELAKILHNMKRRLDDPNIISGDAVLNMLISFREIQDYDAMVTLIDDLKTVPNVKFTYTTAIQFHYAFALNRRNKPKDREKALHVIKKALEKEENRVPDLFCLHGRIYKDIFVESDHTDKEALKNAIHWYRKGFEVQPNEYAGINLATLLVIDGNEFSKSSELQHIGIILNNLIGRKGSLSSLEDYWDVATFFEISVLAEDYVKAIQAAECMFKLKPPDWHLKSTIGNIRLINRFRKKSEETEITAEEQVFHFWLEYFIDATAAHASDCIRFPILILEPTKVYMPSYVTVNMDAEEKSIQISNLCLDTLKGKCHKLHEWLFHDNSIKSVSLYKRDERCLFLYVLQNSDDFQMFFPSACMRTRFYDLLLEMTVDQESVITDLNSDNHTGPIKYEYELDEQGNRTVLGKGTYGIVYAARDLNTQIRLAIKEIPEKNIGDVQPLHEEIKLHSQLSHRNIVKYQGSVSEDGFFKIFMEQVPGGSLSQLLRSKWGPLKDNEHTIVYYTKQILEGLKYLHDQKIVHRDIKGDNVLVNTYTGIVKISDFGTSKRLAGINPVTDTFTGTFQYMAPEVIDKGQRGYGAPADIWSLGCTIVEMATGKPPFTELGCPQAAMFKVGYLKVHPEVPPTMSEKAKRFIERCFETNPDQRASAADLLDDPFLTDSGRKKKTHRPGGQDFSRSISVPADRANKLDKPERVSRFASTGEDGISLAAFGGKTGNTEFLLPRSPSTYSYSSDSADGTIMTRRSSSGMLSPPVDGFHTIQEGEFFMLKKDSQRRTTIVHVLTEDEEKICEFWMAQLQDRLKNLLITSKHLHILLQGLCKYIQEQNKSSLESAYSIIKEEIDFDGNTIHQMQVSLCLFQEAVQSILRSHNIKPHWMFALDNLVRSSVQAALTVLSPELGANLAAQNHREEGDDDLEEGSTSGISTINSMKQSDSFKKYHGQKLQEKGIRLLEEMINVMQQFLYSWKENNVPDRSNSQAQNKRCLDFFSSAHVHVASGSESEFKASGSSFGLNPASGDSSNAPIQVAVSVYGPNEDPELIEWLQNLGLDKESIGKFITEAYTVDDVLMFLTREDLRRLGLRGGMELRVWRAIVDHRKKSSTQNHPTKNK